MTIEPTPVRPGSSLSAVSRPLFDSLRLLLASVVACSAASVVAGCGDADLPPGLTKKAVSIDDVPEALRAAAKKAIPRVDFREAWQNLDDQGKLHSYEIRGRQA